MLVKNFGGTQRSLDIRGYTTWTQVSIPNVNVTNVTNNITVVNKTVTVNKQNVTDIAMLAPVKVAKDLQPEAQIKPVAAEVRRTESENAKQIRSFAAHRAQAEATVAAKQQPNVKLAEPQAIKIEAPKAAVTRAVEAEPAIEIRREEVTTLDPGVIWVIASGPLTSDALALEIAASLPPEEVRSVEGAYRRQLTALWAQNPSLRLLGPQRRDAPLEEGLGLPVDVARVVEERHGVCLAQRDQRPAHVDGDAGALVGDGQLDAVGAAPGPDRHPGVGRRAARRADPCPSRRSTASGRAATRRGSAPRPHRPRAAS